MNALLLLALSALPWHYLDEGMDLGLTQKIDMKVAAFPAGTQLHLESKEGLSIPGANLLLLKLSQAPCADPELKTEMEIVLPEGNAESTAAGVQIDPNCRWWQPADAAHLC